MPPSFIMCRRRQVCLQPFNLNIRAQERVCKTSCLKQYFRGWNVTCSHCIRPLFHVYFFQKTFYMTQIWSEQFALVSWKKCANLFWSLVLPDMNLLAANSVNSVKSRQKSLWQKVFMTNVSICDQQLNLKQSVLANCTALWLGLRYGSI